MYTRTNVLPLVQGRFITPQQLQSSHPFNQVVPNPEVDMSIHEAAQVMGQAGAAARFGGRKPPQELVEQAASILGRARNPEESMSLHRAAQVLGEAGAAVRNGQEPPPRTLVEKAASVMGRAANPMDVVKAGAIQVDLPTDVLPPCPPGQVRIGGVCQSPRYGHSTVVGNPDGTGKAPPTCPEGMVWDLVMQKCKPGKTPTAPPRRPTGTGKRPVIVAEPKPQPGVKDCINKHVQAGYSLEQAQKICAPRHPGSIAQPAYTAQPPGRVIAKAQPRGEGLDDCWVVGDTTGKSGTGFWMCCEWEEEGKMFVKCVPAEIKLPDDPDSSHTFDIQGRTYGVAPAREGTVRHAPMPTAHPAARPIVRSLLAR